MIRTEGLCKRYNPHSKHEVHALTDINLQLPRGSLALFNGPSGSGKTTLLNIIGTLDRAASGKVFIDDDDVTAFSDIALSALRRNKIGFIFQDFNLMPRLSIMENVSIPLIPQGITPRERCRRAKLLLEKMGLGDKLYHRPEELSGGQQQRVAIARALVGHPDIIIADEPTSNIDEDTGEQVIKTMKELNDAGSTILVASHDARFRDIADEIFVLRNGKIL